MGVGATYIMLCERGRQGARRHVEGRFEVVMEVDEIATV